MSDVLINSFSVQPAFSYSNGTVDSAFASNVGTAGSSVGITHYTVCPDPANGLLVGGNFTSWNGSAVNYLVRLNENGTRDTTFQTNLGTGPSSNVRMIKYSPSQDKFYVVGGFSSWNGTTVGRMVRLNRDGTRDTTFQTNMGTGATSTIFFVEEQSDSKVVLGGNFTTWSGTSGIGRILRLNSDGTRDTAFTTNVGTGASAGQVSDVAIDANGKIVAVGNFTSFSTSTAKAVVRLNADGSLDTAFNTNLGSGSSQNAYRVAVRPDGKIVFMMTTSAASWNGGAQFSGGSLVCLNSDGTADTTFAANRGTGFGGSPMDTGILAQKDNKIVVGGMGSNTYNGVAVGAVVRINPDGTLDTSFNFPYSSVDVGAGHICADGKQRIVVVGSGSYAPTWYGTSRFS